MIVKEPESAFPLAPGGVHGAVCCDVVDMGFVDTQWGPKEKLRLVFELSENMENGKPFLISTLYGATLHKKATLRKDLEAWRGKEFTKEELEGWELDGVIGVPASVQVMHKSADNGKVYANIVSLSLPAKGTTTLKLSGTYVRVQDREGYVAPSGQPPQGSDHAPEALDEDDDVPF